MTENTNSQKVSSEDSKSNEDHYSDAKGENTDDDDNSSNASSEYEVEKILAKRRRKRGGGFEYFIKWVGYDDSANEWIPESSLNCPERLAEFERQEKQRSQKESKQRSPIKRRVSTRKRKLVKRRRVNILHDDDDDSEDDFLPVQTSKQNLNTSQEPNSTDLTTYGVELGYKVLAVLGLTRSNNNEVHYLVHYQSPTHFDDNMELLPAELAKRYCEDEIIQFYQTRIIWNERQRD